jgi:hypothetical protein
MNHAKTSLSTDIFAGVIFSVVQYLAPLQFVVTGREYCIIRMHGSVSSNHSFVGVIVPEM